LNASFRWSACTRRMPGVTRIPHGSARHTPAECAGLDGSTDDHVLNAAATMAPGTGSSAGGRARFERHIERAPAVEWPCACASRMARLRHVDRRPGGASPGQNLAGTDTSARPWIGEVGRRRVGQAQGLLHELVMHGVATIHGDQLVWDKLTKRRLRQGAKACGQPRAN